MAVAIAPRSWRAKLLKIADEAPGVRTFRFEAPPDFEFFPGMWVMISFSDEPEVSRAYSMSSSPLERGYIELTLSKVGKFTARLFDLAPGAYLKLKGPYGKWHYDDGVSRAVLVSGGTGITPLRSMARYVLGKPLPGNSLSIFYSAKTPDDVIYRAELEQLARQGVKVWITVTRPASEHGRPWTGPTGRLSAELIRREAADFDSAVFFICGPNSLVSDIAGGLRALGVAPERIRHEKWGDY